MARGRRRRRRRQEQAKYPVMVKMAVCGQCHTKPCRMLNGGWETWSEKLMREWFPFSWRVFLPFFLATIFFQYSTAKRYSIWNWIFILSAHIGKSVRPSKCTRVTYCAYMLAVSRVYERVCLCWAGEDRFSIRSRFSSLCRSDGRINVRACNRFVGLWMCVRWRCTERTIHYVREREREGDRDTNMMYHICKR